MLRNHFLIRSIHPAWLLLCLLGLSLACNLPVQILSDPTPDTTPLLGEKPVAVDPGATPFPSATPQPSPTPTPLPVVRVANGDRALFLGDYQAALEAYHSANAEADDPQVKAAAQLGIGRAHLYLGDYPAALDALRQVISSHPDSPQVAAAHFFLGQVYRALTRDLEAAQAYQAYRSLRPARLDSYVSELAGDALFATGDYAAALAEYTTSLNSPRLPTDFSLEIKLAQTYALLGDYDTALIMYEDIYNRTASAELKAQVNYYQGQTYQALNQPAQAYTAYQNAVDNFPESYFAYLGLVELVNAEIQVDELQRGIIDYYANEPGVALAAFERYLMAEPADPGTALHFRGLIRRFQGDAAGAIQDWDLVLLQYPESPYWAITWEEKAFTQWAYLDQYASAQQTLLDFITATPDHPRAAQALFTAARIAERDGRLQDATKLWERLPAEYPASEYPFQALFQAGLCHYRLGDFAAALVVFTNAQAQAINESERSSAYFWIGKVHQAAGNLDAARAAWDQATVMDPTGYYSERARDALINRPHFTPPGTFDLGMDLIVERQVAEEWMRTTFGLPIVTDFSIPGPLASDPRFIRGAECWELGLYSQAQLEYEDLRQSLISDPVNSYRLANYLAEIGLYRSAILAARQVLDLAGLSDATTLTAPPLFNHIRFGTYYRELIIPLAQEYNFHPFFLWSVIRQESLFEGFILSSAGARGLMQIMPATGADIASRLGWPADYSTADLNRPAINARLGVDYLSDQRDSFGGDLLAALAAYNGGPGNAAIWKDLSQGDPDLLVEVVRFEETRKYLRAIYEIFTIYRRIYERTP
jgi:soluble lytic murein transglycosylase